MLISRGFLALGILLTALVGQAFEISSLKLGTYRNQDCKVTIAPYFQKYVEIQAVQSGVKYISIAYNPSTAEFFDPVARWNDGEKSAIASEYEAQTAESEILSLRLRFGGTWKARDLGTEISINTSTAELLNFKGNLQIASKSLSNGMHSGPLKDLHSAVDCQDLKYQGPDISLN